MTDLYPPESRHMDFIGHLEELRQRILICLAFLLGVSVVLFSQGRNILLFLERPAQGLIKEFIFITPTEVFSAYVKVVLLAAFMVCFPIILYEAWLFLAPAVSQEVRKVVFGWLMMALLCFLAGIFFSYTIALPAALQFLLSFGEGLARPAISLTKYVSFAAAIIFVGACIFEIPVVMGLLTRVGILKAAVWQANRRYSILIIFIVAAVITPTQDIFNLLIFALPMLLLYEVGVVVSKTIEQKTKID